MIEEDYGYRDPDDPTWDHEDEDDTWPEGPEDDDDSEEDEQCLA